MNIWLAAVLTLTLTHFITSYAKSKFSWTKTKANWAENHKATLVSFGVSIALTSITVATGGFNVPTIIAIVSLTGLSEILLNRRKNP